jgi:hypothetical protein
MRLALLDPEAADRGAEVVARLMARELGWQEPEVARQLEGYWRVRAQISLHNVHYLQ